MATSYYAQTDPAHKFPGLALPLQQHSQQQQQHQQQQSTSHYQYEGDDLDEDEEDVDGDDEYIDESDSRRRGVSVGGVVVALPVPNHSRPRFATTSSLPQAYMRPIAQAPPNHSSASQPPRSRPFALVPRKDPTLIFNPVSRVRSNNAHRPPPSKKQTIMPAIMTQRPSNVKRVGGPGHKVTLSVSASVHEINDLASPDPNEPGTVMISGVEAVTMTYTDFAEGMFVVRNDLTDIMYPPQLEPPSRLTPLRCLCCKKVYNGPNARSMWRRHITQKHGFTLGGKKGNGKGKRADEEDDENINPEAPSTSREDLLTKKRKYAQEKRVRDKLLAAGVQPYPPYDKPTTRLVVPRPSKSYDHEVTAADELPFGSHGNGRAGHWASNPLNDMVNNVSHGYDEHHSQYYPHSPQVHIHDDDDDDDEEEDHSIPALLTAHTSFMTSPTQSRDSVGDLQSPFLHARDLSEDDDDHKSNMGGFSIADLIPPAFAPFDDHDSSLASLMSGGHQTSDFDFDISLQSEVSLLTSPVAQREGRAPVIVLSGDDPSSSKSEITGMSSMLMPSGEDLGPSPILPDTPIRNGLQNGPSWEAQKRKMILSLDSPTSYPTFLRSRTNTAINTSSLTASPNPLATLFRSHTTLGFAGSFLHGNNPLAPSSSTSKSPLAPPVTSSTPRRPSTGFVSSTWLSELTGVTLFESPVLKRKRGEPEDLPFSVASAGADSIEGLVGGVEALDSSHPYGSLDEDDFGQYFHQPEEEDYEEVRPAKRGKIEVS